MATDTSGCIKKILLRFVKCGHFDHVGEAEFAPQKCTDGHSKINISIGDERDGLRC